MCEILDAIPITLSMGMGAMFGLLTMLWLGYRIGFRQGQRQLRPLRDESMQDDAVRPGAMVAVKISVKPRIRLSNRYQFGTPDRIWECYDEETCAPGSTPAHAYRWWRVKKARLARALGRGQ